MKEREQLMKKESNTKYIILIVLIVLALGYVAYDKFDINLKNIDLFKDKQVDNSQVNLNHNHSNEIWGFEGENILPFLFVAIVLFILSMFLFIKPLFNVGKI